jgi:hypothetical protein
MNVNIFYLSITDLVLASFSLELHYNILELMICYLILPNMSYMISKESL